jgi:hypothetical protein
MMGCTSPSGGEEERGVDRWAGGSGERRGKNGVVREVFCRAAMEEKETKESSNRQV